MKTSTLPAAIQTITAKADSAWNRDDLYAARDFLAGVRDADMTEETINLLFRTGEVEERLLMEAGASYADLDD